DHSNRNKAKYPNENHESSSSCSSSDSDDNTHNKNNKNDDDDNNDDNKHNEDGEWFLRKRFSVEICHALQYLHENNKGYRHFRPSNILLSENYHIKLSEYGLNRIFKLAPK